MKLWAVAERDLRRMLRNPATLLGAVLLPLVYLFVLGNSLLGPVKDLRLGVVTFDDGRETRRLLGALSAVQNGPRTVRLIAVDGPLHGMELLHGGRLAGLLVVPRHFSSDVESGIAATLGLFVDNVDAVASNAIVVAVKETLPSLKSEWVRFELSLGPAEVRTLELFPRVDYDTSLVPGVVVMAIFMGSMISGGFNLVMDRFLGVHESYLSTPLRRRDIALGVLLSGTLVTLAASSAVMWVGMLATGARVRGGLSGYAAIIAVQVLTTVGLLALMMVLLGRVNHPRITGLLGGFLNVILFFPSGALYPIESFPAWLRAFAAVNPEAHAIAALKEMLFRGGDLVAAGGHVAFLALFALGMAALATLLLKRTL